MNGRKEPALSNKEVAGAAGKSQAISRRRLHRSPFPSALSKIDPALFATNDPAPARRRG